MLVRYAVTVGGRMGMAFGRLVGRTAQAISKTLASTNSIRRCNLIILLEISKYLRIDQINTFNCKDQCNPEIHSKHQGCYLKNNKVHNRHSRYGHNNIFHHRVDILIRTIHFYRDQGNHMHDDK